MKKIKNQIERLNHKLTVIETEDGLKVYHSEYGFLAVIVKDDEEPVEIIREILTDVSDEAE